jgi:hypothetical protein
MVVIIMIVVVFKIMNIIIEIVIPRASRAPSYHIPRF